MDSIVSAFTSLPSAKAKKDDDFSDRLSSRYTVLLLIVFAIVVSIMHNMWDPIKCWAPVHFTGNHVKYTNSYCWVRNFFCCFDQNCLIGLKLGEYQGVQLITRYPRFDIETCSKWHSIRDSFLFPMQYNISMSDASFLIPCHLFFKANVLRGNKYIL